jgi:hypothetical protein
MVDLASARALLASARALPSEQTVTTIRTTFPFELNKIVYE